MYVVPSSVRPLVYRGDSLDHFIRGQTVFWSFDTRTVPRVEQDHGGIPVVRNFRVVQEVGFEFIEDGSAGSLAVLKKYDIGGGDLEAALLAGVQEVLVKRSRVVDTT